MTLWKGSEVSHSLPESPGNTSAPDPKCMGTICLKKNSLKKRMKCNERNVDRVSDVRPPSIERNIWRFTHIGLYLWKHIVCFTNGLYVYIKHSIRTCTWGKYYTVAWRCRHTESCKRFRVNHTSKGKSCQWAILITPPKFIGLPTAYIRHRMYSPRLFHLSLYYSLYIYVRFMT